MKVLLEQTDRRGPDLYVLIDRGNIYYLSSGYHKPTKWYRVDPWTGQAVRVPGRMCDRLNERFKRCEETWPGGASRVTLIDPHEEHR